MRVAAFAESAMGNGRGFARRAAEWEAEEEGDLAKANHCESGPRLTFDRNLRSPLTVHFLVLKYKLGNEATYYYNVLVN